MRTGICTVGTSLKANWKRNGGTGEPTQAQLVAFLNEHDPVRACAETNTIHRLVDKGRLGPGHRLVFLHSATPDGALCSGALKVHYALHGYETEAREIRGLNYQHKEFANKGLTDLIDTLIDLVDRYGADQAVEMPVIVVATGGFKAEIAYATMTGALLGVPVYYVHEQFEGLVEMPPLPISIDFTFVTEYEELFQKLDEMPWQDEWDAFLRAWRRQGGGFLPARMSHLFLQEEGLVRLSPAGDLIYRTFQGRLAHVDDRRVYLSPQAYKGLTTLESAGRQKVERALMRLLIPEVRADAESKKNSDLRVFPKGARAERVFFFTEGGELYVCEICSHSDQSYERLLSDGVWRDDYKSVAFREYELPQGT
ncbi:MAG: putative CRISPR-associated protein [Limnochordia bacterium]